MGSKYKIGKAFYAELKESIGDLGRRYRKETGKKRASVLDEEYRRIIQDKVHRELEADRYVKKSLNGSTKKYNELMKVRDKFSGGGTMNKKKKKTKDPLIEKYKRVRNTIIAAPEVQALGEVVNDLIGMGGFDDGGLSEDIKKLEEKTGIIGRTTSTGNKRTGPKISPDMRVGATKKVSTMQAGPSTPASKKQYRGVTRKPLADFKSKMKRRAEGGFTDGRKKIDKAPPFGVINADDFKALKAMKKKSTGGIMVPVKLGKNKITKIM